MRIVFLLAILASSLFAQALEPEQIIKPGKDLWPTYNGDYTGRRYSTIDVINKTNVHSLTLAWAFQSKGGLPIKGTPLMVNGVLYVTAPEHVWAVDGRTGRLIWHYQRPSEGNHIGQRGVAVYKDRLYLGTPDAHLICLNARDGKLLWEKEIADVKFGYYISMAPLVVGDRLLIGTSGDQADVPHFLEARNPENGDLLWRWNALPKWGAPGSETWPNKNALSHGGGPAWMTGTYDPKLKLIYWGTGNPHPVLGGTARAGANLYTCTIVALNPENGKLVWHFQSSPHDTHDWDAVETPVLIDANFQGKPRKLLAQASRNGYYFLLDRATGKNLVSKPFVPINWSRGVDEKGQPIPDPEKDPQTDGALIQSYSNGGTNWNAPSYSPQTGLFYVNAQEGYSLYYANLDEHGKPEGHQGGRAVSLWNKASLLALNYATGEVAWRRDEGSAVAYTGVLSTAGGLVFTADVQGNLLALDAHNGKLLWHSYGGGIMGSSPMTYELDGRQYVLTAVDGVVFAWSLPEK